MKKNVTINAPRTLKIFLIQYMSIVPFATAIIILFIITTSNTSSSLNDLLLIGFAFILPLFFIGFSMLYFPQQFKIVLIFDRNNNILHKVKKKEEQSFNIETARSLNSKIIKTNYICKYNLILEDNENDSQMLFNENIPFGLGHWEEFTENLSKILNLPLIKE